MNPETINMLTTLNLFLRRQLGIVDKRNAKSAAKALRFAKLSVDMQLESPVDLATVLDEEFDADPFLGEDESDEDE